MRGAWILYHKEMLESVRNYKLIWIPVVFIILGIMQPLTSYYMPEILRASGDIPPALLESFEIPIAAEVMAQALGQYGSIGLLVLALGAMNAIAGERYSGTAEMVLVRPVSPVIIVFAKWAAQLTLIIIALGLGALGAGYYTEQLIGPLPWGAVIAAAALYGLWLLCIVSMTLLFSTFLRGAVAAFLALFVAAGLSLAHSLLPSWFDWMPVALTGLSAKVLTEGGKLNLWPCFSAVVLIIISMTGASLLMRKNSLSD